MDHVSTIKEMAQNAASEYMFGTHRHVFDYILVMDHCSNVIFHVTWCIGAVRHQTFYSGY
jgi:hypothetical protein